VLVVCVHPPGAGFAARETLDLALGFAAFDQEVSLLFRGEGVRCLQQPLAGDDDPEGIARLLAVMPDYGITRVIATAEDLLTRLPSTATHTIAVDVIPAQELARLIAGHDLVIRC
jgi:sulfur relay (sulfurtransferase) DsrF/TusC family protein